ncbi:MAG: ORF6N domain-containing protein [Bacteroidota bacterium]
MNKAIGITDEHVVNKIYLVKGKRIMLDSGLAALYDVGTKVLNQSVKRNLSRFPEDFMFQLTEKEWQNLRSQTVTSSWGGRRTLPFVFTEQGVAMLSSVLGSETAIHVNIQIIRVFTRMREMLLNNKSILVKIEEIEQKILKQDISQKKQEEDIREIFDVLKELIRPVTATRKRIGFRKD